MHRMYITLVVKVDVIVNKTLNTDTVSVVFLAL
jgi:hypothetical protein